LKLNWDVFANTIKEFYKEASSKRFQKNIKLSKPKYNIPEIKCLRFIKYVSGEPTEDLTVKYEIIAKCRF